MTYINDKSNREAQQLQGVKNALQVVLRDFPLIIFLMVMTAITAKALAG